MAKRLTEEMVIARTKISDLSKIKRLNCWGSELGDVSLLKKMPSVEVLSLSINKINSLEDFSLCKRLEELYIRQNDIRDLNQIVYLQSLPNLKNLWLGENPCASIDGYRQAVLRALPNLQKLDNVAVSPEELKDALRKGKALCHPDDEQDSEEEDTYIPAAATVSSQQYNNRYQQDYPAEPEYVSPHRSPSRQDPPIELENGEPETFYPSKEEPPEELPQELSPPRQLSPARRQADPATVTKRTYSPEQEYSEQRRRSSHDLGSPKYGHTNTQTNYYDRSPPFATNEDCTSNGATTDNYKEHRLVSSQSTNSILKEYTNGDRYGNNPPYRQQTEGSEVSYNQDNNSSTTQQRRERQFTPCAAAQRAPFTRRPVTRNSNILSAVLCLVKELDYPSLEVVEMAVRCRMDELDE